jgi:hypothetical protein
MIYLYLCSEEFMWIWCCLEPQVTAGSTVNLGRYREPQDATIGLNSTVNGRLIPNSGRYSCSPQSPDRLQTLGDIPTHHVPDAHYPVKKRLENEADLTSPCSAEFWNAWNYATRTSYVQHRGANAAAYFAFAVFMPEPPWHETEQTCSGQCATLC